MNSSLPDAVLHADFNDFGPFGLAIAAVAAATNRIGCHALTPCEGLDDERFDFLTTPIEDSGPSTHPVNAQKAFGGLASRKACIHSGQYLLNSSSISGSLDHPCSV